MRVWAASAAVPTRLSSPGRARDGTVAREDVLAQVPAAFVPVVDAARAHAAVLGDASLGGLGGCPYAPGASGNLASEELVHMLHDLGIATGVDLSALIESAELAQRLVGRELPSAVLRAGPRTRRTELPR